MKSIPKANRNGNCYQAAGSYFMDQGLFNRKHSLVLVHGEVVGQGPVSGIKFGHAWLEDGNQVIDISNGKDIKMPKELYYAIGRIEKTNRYGFTDFQRAVQKYHHWGPWED